MRSTMAGYTIKVIEHNNGSVELRQYERGVGKNKNRPKQKKKGDDTFKPQTVMLEGFGECLCFPDYKTLVAYRKKQEYSTKNSISLTKKKIFELANAFPTDQQIYFVTLTYDPKILETKTVDGLEIALKKARIWVQNIKSKYCKDMYYLAIPEAHKKKEDTGRHRYHMHLLISNIDSLPLEDSGMVAIKKRMYKRNSANSHNPTVYRLPLWRYGFSNCIPIVNSERMAHYLVKYISKSVAEDSARSHSHRYFASRNLKKATVTTYSIDISKQDQWIEEYLKEHKQEIGYATITNRFIEMKTYKLQSKSRT